MTAVTLLIVGCATTKQPVPASVDSAHLGDYPKSILIKGSVAGRSTSGFLSAIRGGTKWILYGTLKEGAVYKPLDTTLTVEGERFHEAYLVTRDGKWVGFYLPVEKMFSVINQTMPLEIEKPAAN